MADTFAGGEVMAGRHPGGRPQKLTPQQIKVVVSDFTKYIDETEDPTIVGFCATYPLITLKDGSIFYVGKDYISDHTEFSDLRKKAIQKQEAYLLKNGTTNKANPTMAIFRLKQPQHGFKDKTELDANLNGNVTFINAVPRPKK